ncbi:MAG TPA: hypothetical protein VHZ50_07650 [Puia sp.]|jgi:hypothetical protein|nr:hypothetical protein [Puia sp.]
MTAVVSRKLTKKEKEKLFNSKKGGIKPLIIAKYKGKFKWDGDALKLQKEWRNEL